MSAGRAALLLLLLGGCGSPEPASTGERDPFGKRAAPIEEGAAPAYRRRAALVVGVSAYSNFASLEGPTHDAAEVARLLASRFGFEAVLLVDRPPTPPLPPDVRVELAPGGVTRERLVAALAALRDRAGPRDALLFYFAGHGLKGNLVPSDGRLGGGLLSHAELGRALRDCDAHHTLAVLDACFSGSAIEALSVGALGPPVLRAAERDNLARVFNRRSFQVLTAGTGEETVGDQVQVSKKYAELQKDLEGHSPFTGVLLQGLRGLTGRPDGMLAGSELAYYLSRTLVNENESFRARQAPRFATFGGGDGDFLFIPVHAVLNPSLVAPIYVAGAEYAQLRRSACEALARSIAARRKEDQARLVEAALPHLSRLLRDEAEGPRIEAARAVADLAGLVGGSPIEGFRATVPLLTHLLTQDRLPEAARALGALAAFADQEAVKAQGVYFETLRTRFKGRLGDRAQPDELRERIGAAALKWPAADASPAEWMSKLEEGRILLEWLNGEGTRILADYERRHEQGKEMLQRAERYLQGRELFEARATAARAAGLDGGKRLLWERSAEEERARTILQSTPDARPLWKSTGPVHHAAALQAVLPFRGGKSLVSLDKTGKIRVWAIESGALESSFDASPELGRALAVSADGSKVASGGRQGYVVLWNPSAGKVAGPTATGVDDVSALAFSPDGKILAVGDQRGKILLFDPATGRPLRTVEGHRKEVTSMLFDATGKRLVSACEDGSIRVWDAATGKELAAPPVHTATVGHLALHPDGKTLLSVDTSGNARLWDLDRSVPAGELQERGRGLVGGAFSPDGSRVALTGFGGLALRSLPGSDLLWEKPSADGTRSVAPAFNADGSRVFEVVGSTIRTRDAATGAEIGSLGVHGEAVSGVAWSPDEKTFVSFGVVLRLWDTESGELLRSVDSGDGIIRAFAFSPDGGTVAIGRGTRLEIAEAGTFRRRWISDPFESHLDRVAFSPDGARVVVVAGKDVSTWETSSQRRTARFALSADPSAAAVSPDGRWVAWGTRRGALELVATATGVAAWTRFSGRAITDIAFTPGGEALATCMADQVIFWQPSTGEEIRRIPSAGAERAVFSPDATHLAVGATNGVKVYKLSQKEGPPALSLGGDRVTALAFRPNGRELLLCRSERFEQGEDVLWIWDTGLRRESFRVVNADEAVTPLLAVGDRGRVFATALPGENGQVRVHEGLAGVAYRRIEVPALEITALAMSPDGRRLAIGTWGGVQIHDLWKGGKTGTITLDRQRVGSLAFDRDGARLAVAVRAQMAMAAVVVDVATGKQWGSFARDPRVPSAAVGFTASGRLVVGDEEGYLSVWEGTAGTPLRSLRVLREVRDLACSPRDEVVACVGPGPDVALWDSSQAQDGRRLGGHGERAWSPRFSFDGALLVTGGGTGELRVWDWKAGKEIDSVPAAWTWQGSVDFGLDTGGLISVEDQGALRFWPLRRTEAAPGPSFFRFEATELVGISRPADNLYRAQPERPAPRRGDASLRVRMLNLLSNIDPGPAIRLFPQIAEAERTPLQATLQTIMGLRLVDSLTAAVLPDTLTERLAAGKSVGLDMLGYMKTLAAFEHLAAGRHEEAAKDFQEGAGLSAAQRNLFLLGCYRILKDPKREAEAFEAFRQVRTYPPVEYEDWLIQMLEGKLDVKSIVADTEKSLGERALRLAHVNYVLGVMALGRDNKEEARAAFAESSKLSPGPGIIGELARAELRRLGASK